MKKIITIILAIVFCFAFGLVYQFLTEKYGYSKSKSIEKELEFFQLFLQQLPNHTVVQSQKNASYEIVLFLAHMERDEIELFVKYLDDTRKKARGRKSKIIHSLRHKIKKYAIVFVTGSALFHILCLDDSIRLRNHQVLVGDKSVWVQVPSSAPIKE